jgi:hypothetical protein
MPDRPEAGFCGTSGKRASFAPILAQFACHKIEKRGALTLSKAHRRWYIPAAPNGLRAPGLPSQEALMDGTIGALAAFAHPISSSEFLQGAQRLIAGWSSPVARQAHNLKVTGSNPVPATRREAEFSALFEKAALRGGFFCFLAGSPTGSHETVVARHYSHPDPLVHDPTSRHSRASPMRAAAAR